MSDTRRFTIVPIVMGLLLATVGVEFSEAEDQVAEMTEPSSGLDTHIRDLSHPDYQVRWKALEALAKLGPQAESAVPALITRLEDDYDRYRAISVLGAIGPAAAPAVPALLDRLAYTLSVEDKLYRDESTEAIGIIETLAKIGPTARVAVPLLRKALKDQVSTIRYFAAYALGEMGPEANAAIPELEALLTDHEYVGLYLYPYGKDVADVVAQTLQKLQGTANNDAAPTSTETWMGKTEPVPQDWKHIDANGKFTFFVPPDMEEEVVQGTDSYVGQYRSTNVRLYFDYGWWPGNLCDARYTAQKPQHRDAATQIGGQPARLVTFYEPDPKMDHAFPHIAVVCFADLGTEGPGQTITLTMWANGQGRAEQQTAAKIFRSIKFSR
jgi:hypothetical protein